MADNSETIPLMSGSRGGAEQSTLRRSYAIAIPTGTSRPLLPSARVEERSIDKNGQAEIRRKIFLHLDGIALATTITALEEKGILAWFARVESASLRSLVDRFGGNVGYLNVALRLLACQGWLTRVVGANGIGYTLTAKGRGALKLAPVYRELSAFVPLAIRIDEYLFSSLPESAVFRRLIERSARGWDLDGAHRLIREQVHHHLDGMLVGPTMVALAMHGVFDSPDLRCPQAGDHLREAFALLVNQGWAVRAGERVRLTPPGRFAASRAYAYGVTVSYLPTFLLVPELIFGDPTVLTARTVGGDETHVHREMNVWGSGRAHHTYFKKVDDIIVDIFERSDRPLGIADMGCGDGALVEHIYRVIKTRTARGRTLAEDPLIVVCADYNEAALATARTRLTGAGIPHIAIFGDINDPDDFARRLQLEHGILLSEVLSVRSFLDHNRPYQPPIQTGAPGRPSRSTGAFAHQGRMIEGHELFLNLTEHFRRWAAHLGRFGLLVLDLHTVDSEQAARQLGRTLATPYDATHGYSDQYPVELSEFLDAARAAGLESEPRYAIQYPSAALAAISINLLTPKPTTGTRL